MQQPRIRGLYYITHIDNIPSILNNGILSRGRIDREGMQPANIHNREVVNLRKDIPTPDGKSLWFYANLFFQPRNPMMYRIIDEIGKQNLAIAGISNTVLQERGIFITDGIAANNQTQFYRLREGLEMLRAQQEIIQSRSWVSWNNNPEIKRKLMAECLVPSQVNPEHIRKFLVADHAVAGSLRGRVSPTSIQLVVAKEIGSDIFTPFS